ncbi:hypothetical protein M5689_005588 [Euphorbia peplus]|nr:hypothetical protein M5689_005588 [Euphorbia peplus]
MASFWFLFSLITSLIISQSLPSSSSSSTMIKSQPSPIPTSPNSNSPFQEISPEIAPLLPSQGGVLPTPSVTSLPTIPSNPSPPNPDAFFASGPGSAFSPFGSFPASSASASPRNLAMLVVATCMSFLVVQ